MTDSTGQNTTRLTLDQALHQAIAHHRAGRLQDAERLYRAILRAQPNHMGANRNLALLATVQGNKKQPKSKPPKPNEHAAKPASHCEASPQEVNALAALFSQGRYMEMENAARELTLRFPQHGICWKALGTALIWQERNVDALEPLQKAARLLPGDADTHNNLGFILKAQGRFAEAGASYRRALEIKPDYATVHNNLGVIFKEQGRLAEAEASYRRALEIKPDYATVHNNLGVIFKEQDRPAEAEASYRRALEIKPDFVDAHYNLGIILRNQGRLSEAEASYRRALEIKPDFVDAHSNLLFTLNFTASHSPSYSLEQARQYGRMVKKKVGARFSLWQCAPLPERLRVGLVSGDLRNHSVGHFLESLLVHIDPARIELIAYPTDYKADKLTARIKPYFAAWKPLFGLGDEAAARLIHADGVHVLLDLSGHTEHNRLPLFAWKPAPVQVGWLGFPSTTGMAEMDYVLGDPYAIPPECENHFSEAVWRMPESYLCFTPPTPAVEIALLPALATGYVTFGSFNNLTKMNDAVVALWARVLKAVPNSRLMLKTKQLNNSDACEKTRQRFVSYGIAPDRLLLSGALASADDHLAAYNKVDVALDTFPYPGVTTSVEALWMGVPVLTLRGDRFLSHTAESIAHNAGLPDWIAIDGDDYVAKAVAYTENLERLAALRAGLRQQVLASPLFDAPRFARNFESALWEMWQHYQD